MPEHLKVQAAKRWRRLRDQSSNPFVLCGSKGAAAIAIKHQECLRPLHDRPRRMMSVGYEGDSTFEGRVTERKAALS